MTNRKISWMLAGLGVACILFLFAGEALCQDTGGADPGGGGFRRRFDPNMIRGFDPNMLRNFDANMLRNFDANAIFRAIDANQIRKMAADQIQQALGATDEEWTILEPKVEKVMTLSMQLQGGGMGMIVAGLFGQSGEQSDLAKARQALMQVLARPDASPGEVNDALKTYRDARAKAKAQLDKAQADLKELLSLRQEALLVQRGLLD